MSVYLIFTLLLSACNKELQTYQEQGYVFGTLVEISIYGEDEARSKNGITSVMQEFQRLHDQLHAWKPSELSSLNAAFAQGKSKQISAELATMLQDATQLSAQSGGFFNPAIGGLIQSWGFQAEDFKAALPDEKKIASLVKGNPQMSDIVFAGNRLHSRNKAVQIDLGGFAKGYALDRASDLLKQSGIHNALINIGGNVLALGKHGDREWRVGIQHPRKPGPLATLALHDGDAIGTSGDYQRYFELGGRRYCHLIDPRTGQPVQGVQAVTILTHGEHAGVLSDAASKPIFISGITGWQISAQKMHIDDALLIDDTGKVHLTTAMNKRLEFTDKSIAREVVP
jgi:thiamine biosynthesis lipoprotein